MKRETNLDRTLRELRDRKAKLEQVRQLQSEVNKLESQVWFGDEKLGIAMGLIAGVVCEHFRLPVASVCSECREAHLVTPRHAIFVLARRLTGAPCTTIGRLMKRDHATVIYGMRSLRDRMETEPSFAESFSDIEAKCRVALAQAMADGCPTNQEN